MRKIRQVNVGSEKYFFEKDGRGHAEQSAFFKANPNIKFELFSPLVEDAAADKYVKETREKLEKTKGKI